MQAPSFPVKPEDPSVVVHSYSPLSRQMEVTIEYLNAAPDYVINLSGEISKRFPDTHLGCNARDIVAWFLRPIHKDKENTVKKHFFAVRAALTPSNRKKPGAAIRQEHQRAAVALWCLSALGLVDQTTHDGGKVLLTPSGEPIICAIVATALFGGEIHFESSTTNDLLTPKYFYEIDLRCPTDKIKEEFEYKAHAAMVEGKANETGYELDQRELTEDEREALKARIDTLENVPAKASFALIIRGITRPDPLKNHADAYGIPVFLPDTDASKQLLGMTPKALIAQIREFSKELETFCTTAKPSPTRESSMSQPEDKPMPAPANVYNIHAPTTFGASSPAQSGDHALAQIYNNNAGLDSKSLIAIFDSLRQEIDRLSGNSQRDHMSDQVALAKGELANDERADVSRVKRALDTLKTTAEALGNGDKILTLCHQAYGLLAPFLS